jgi:uncharacterized protein YndB with AHSA1/START domain
MSEPFVFRTTRRLAAPRELVWAAWTEAERLAAWFGPAGTTVEHSTMDLRPGGIYHYGLRGPDGTVYWGRWIIQEIVPPERLVVVSSFSDAEGGVTRHPLGPDWPLETHSTMTLAEEDGTTLLRLEWTPWNATESELAAFADGADGMEQGWGGTFAQLEVYLARQ